MNENMELRVGIDFATYDILDDDGKRYARFLLEKEAMPAELIYVLERWVELPDYDPWTVNQCLRHVALQFGWDDAHI